VQLVALRVACAPSDLGRSRAQAETINRRAGDTMSDPATGEPIDDPSREPTTDPSGAPPENPSGESAETEGDTASGGAPEPV
jgi:hypothetical protein